MNECFQASFFELRLDKSRGVSSYKLCVSVCITCLEGVSLTSNCLYIHVPAFQDVCFTGNSLFLELEGGLHSTILYIFPQSIATTSILFSFSQLSSLEAETEVESFIISLTISICRGRNQRSLSHGNTHYQ